MKKLLLYFNTVKYLRFSQIFWRIFYKVICRKPSLSSAPEHHNIKPETGFPKIENVFDGNIGFTFLNLRREIAGKEAWNAPELDPLWRYNLHYFDWLRQHDITEDAANASIERWINENPPLTGAGWNAYPISLRVVNWIKYAAQGHHLSPSAIENMAVQLRALMNSLEYHLLGNHLLANAKALVFGGMFFRGKEAETWLKKGLSIYRKELPEQILADGGHFELSPMYHSIMVEDLLDLKNINAPMTLDELIGRMLRWLDGMCGGKGEIALFNDGAYKVALPPEVLFDYGRKLGIKWQSAPGNVFFPDSGYARLARGPWQCICDGAAIGPDYLPGHSHADTLNFELWLRGFKMICDTGTYLYKDSPVRRFQRGTTAHNTVCLDHKNSSHIWGAHRAAERAFIVEREFSDACFTAAHNGYRPAIHKRIWKLAEELTVIDRIEFNDRQSHDVEIYFHFAPECQVTLQRDKLIIDTPEGRAGLCAAGNAGELHSSLEEYEMSREYGLLERHKAVKFFGRFRDNVEIQTEIKIIE